MPRHRRSGRGLCSAPSLATYHFRLFHGSGAPPAGRLDRPLAPSPAYRRAVPDVVGDPGKPHPIEAGAKVYGERADDNQMRRRRESLVHLPGQ
jgi:hypothetical protein